MNLANAKGFMKKHAFELSCGGVAVLALAVCYFGVPFLWDGLPAVSAELAKNANDRINLKGSINSVLKDKPSLEGVSSNKIPPEEVAKITFTTSLGQLREEANKQMQSTRGTVLQSAAVNNRARRVRVGSSGTDGSALFMDKDLEYELKLKPGESLLKSKGKTAPNTTYGFVGPYQDSFVTMTSQLTGSTGLLAGVVTDLATLEKAYAEEKKSIEDAEPAAFKNPSKTSGGPGAPVAVNTKERDEFVRNAIYSIANRTQMYVDPRTAFQQRSMGGAGKIGADVPAGAERRPPSHNEIWEGYVDVWLQRDVVDSIIKTNKENAARKELGVAKSFIPRLLEIKIGPSAKNNFPTTAQTSPLVENATGGAAGNAPSTTLDKGLFERLPGSTEVKLDPNFSMTGRMGDADSYVVLMSVSVVIEPSAINKFIKNLYNSNNGYTVINMRQTTVDPYEAASNGFLYGDRQCVKLDLLVECLMFKSWVDLVIPEGYTPTP